jgi:hypothetical protein
MGVRRQAAQNGLGYERKGRVTAGEDQPQAVVLDLVGLRAGSSAVERAHLDRVVPGDRMRAVSGARWCGADLRSSALECGGG